MTSRPTVPPGSGPATPEEGDAPTQTALPVTGPKTLSPQEAPTKEPTQQRRESGAKLRDLEVGEVLQGAWRLDSKLGQGGMGSVYLATELKLNRKVAVKALHTSNLDEETMKRFEREAQVMGKLDHPNLVTLYGVGRHRNIPFLVMRYLEGGSLWDVLDANHQKLSPEQMLPIVKQLCSALGYLHQKSIIHRDLKPSNIFVGPTGKVTLLDLGLARGHESSLTRTGIIWGTPDFMAPEQIVGERQLDGRSDLYALAVVVYRMLANQPPFADEEEQTLMRSHLTKPRPDISKVMPSLSPSLGAMLQKAMAIKPEDRYQTAEELSAAFEQVVTTKEESTKVGARPAEPSTIIAKYPSRHGGAQTQPEMQALVAAPTDTSLSNEGVAEHLDKTMLDRTRVVSHPTILESVEPVTDSGGITLPSVSNRRSAGSEAPKLTPRPPSPRRSAPRVERPVWMHPYLLGIGAALLLALGFLLGMLAR